MNKTTAERLAPDVLEFFYKFSRFEFAMKEKGYFRPEKPSSFVAIKPSWKKFKSEFEEKYEISCAGTELINLSPNIQVVGPDSSVKWQSVTFEVNPSDLSMVIDLLCVVRNNMFHGGKHGHVSWNDEDRIRELLKVGILVLDELADFGGFRDLYMGEY